MWIDDDRFVKVILAHSYAKGWLESIEGDELFIEHNRTEYDFYKTTEKVLGEIIAIQKRIDEC